MTLSILAIPVNFARGNMSRRQFCVVNFQCGKTIFCLCCLFSDINECTDYSPSCHVNDVCQNTVDSHTCSCKDGKQCHTKNSFKQIQQKRLNAIFYLLH